MESRTLLDPAAIAWWDHTERKLSVHRIPQREDIQMTDRLSSVEPAENKEMSGNLVNLVHWMILLVAYPGPNYI